jgi:hypothetical protein
VTIDSKLTTGLMWNLSDSTTTGRTTATMNNGTGAMKGPRMTAVSDIASNTFDMTRPAVTVLG